MPPFYLLNLQTTFSLIAFALIAKWHITPRLAKLPLEDALILLLWIHVFRYTPLTLFAPGQVDPNLPQSVANSIAYGDLISAILAFIAILFLRYRLTGAILVAWIFNIVGIADIVNALIQGVGAELYKYPKASVKKFAFLVPSGAAPGTGPAPEGPAVFPTGYFDSRARIEEWLAS